MDVLVQVCEADGGRSMYPSNNCTGTITIFQRTVHSHSHTGTGTGNVLLKPHLRRSGEQNWKHYKIKNGTI
jgi:hypothetical protein